MKRKLVACLLILSMMVSGFIAVNADSNNRFVTGEAVNLNTRTMHPLQEKIEYIPDMGVGLFSLSGYQEKVGALVVVLAFSDTPDSAYEVLGNRLNTLLNGDAGSMKKLFADVSGGKVTYQAQIPQLNADGLVVKKDPNPRAYYERYTEGLNPVGFQYTSDGTFRSDEGKERLHNFITNALNNIPKESLDPNILDGNTDGVVDNVIALFPGPTGEWVDMLWPKSFSIMEEAAFPLLTEAEDEVTLGVGEITFQHYDVDLPTLYHETCHSLGLTDIYNYIDQSKDLGNQWTPMSTGIPYGMNAIEREALGWLVPEVIVPTETAVEYTLKPLAAEDGNAYKIEIEKGKSIYLEYRKADDNLESGIPASGLLAWRCDETLKGLGGNKLGPPYYQYLYRPFGDETAQESTAYSAFSQKLNRTAMGSGTAMPFYMPVYETQSVTDPDEDYYFLSGSGNPIKFVLKDTYDTNISIYDIIETDNELKFKIRLVKPDSVVSDPVFSKAPGSYDEVVSLEMSAPDNGAEVRYTLDGSVPTTQSPFYQNPIEVKGAVTVKAACFKDGLRSNVVEGNYYCYPIDDTAVLPAYDGTGNSQIVLTVPDYDVLTMKFKALTDNNISGTILIYDPATNEGARFLATDLLGAEIRMITNGIVVIVAESPNAKFEVEAIDGINEPVSKMDTVFAKLTDGKTTRIYTWLKKNDTKVTDAKTLIALYDESNMLVQAKMINEKLYNSPYSYLTGADFELLGNETKCGLYVWEDADKLSPLIYDNTRWRIPQE